MAKVNYRFLKRQREEARKKDQLEKQTRRGRVPEGTATSSDPAAVADPATVAAADPAAPVAPK